ncbi:hypothetical protein ACDW_23000 [Acidovorax sp. DW039]|uniref:hypothetical protein n=1 Tax=Acidovorax sp. DW039 TaxID=3095606 RepID=UPI00308B2154|nr:hypothetical protein ACDW_23000 [Acidovorax sp. DW039]
MALLARLLPKQKIQGDGAIQLGRVSGDVKAVTQVVHQHFYPGALSTPEQPRFDPSEISRPKERPPVVLSPDEHKQAISKILKKRDQLLPRERAGFDRWMEEQFKTRYVKVIPHGELHRIQLYLEKTITNREVK